jgi:hypothetical protein
MMGAVTYENELQPFYNFDTERVVNELPKQVNIQRHVPKRRFNQTVSPTKTFLKKHPLAPDPSFALILAERFCDEQ